MNKNLLLASFAVLSLACSPKSQTTNSQNLESEFNSGIVGGVAVRGNDTIARSTVGIASEYDGVFCSGTLIAKNLVITAAHCTGVTADPRDMLIAFHPHQAKGTTRKVLGGQVTKEWPMLDLQKDEDWGDVAILRFEGSLPEGFTPATLLSPATAKTSLKPGMDIQLAGYGVTTMSPQPVDPKKLLKTTVKLSRLFGQTELLFEQFEGRGACHGDSGGPAFAKIKNKWVLVGVTSRSATPLGGYTCLEGSIYTSVSGVSTFIKTTAQYLNSPDFVPGEKIPQPSGM
jgi:secreted trypsin-like serine protease